MQLVRQILTDLRFDVCVCSWLIEEIRDVASRGKIRKYVSEADLDDLLANTASEWITVGTVTCRRFTSKTNGNSIFLPATGYRDGSSLYGQSGSGHYRSSTVYPSYSRHARYLYFDSSSVGTGRIYRYYGLSVRLVQ